MKNLKSQFSIMQVIVTPIVLILVVCFLSSIITFTSLEMTKDGTPLYITPIWIVLLFIALLFYTLRHYLKSFKHYTFLDKGFEVRTVFGKEFYSWNTVKQISIIENSYEKILWQYLEEDTLSIQLKNGKILELFSKYYRNMSILRQYLTSKNRINIINSYNLSRKKFTKSFRKETYKGVFIFSLDGLLALFFVLSFGLVLIIKYSSITVIGFFFIIGIPLIILFSVGLRAYYFQLEERSLIIRNHVFLHVKHKINLETVRAVHFEQKFKKESSIRIINNDFSSVSFQSSTLKDKHWKSLIPKLKEREINVIDYLFYEYNE